MKARDAYKNVCGDTLHKDPNMGDALGIFVAKGKHNIFYYKFAFGMPSANSLPKANL